MQIGKCVRPSSSKTKRLVGGNGDGKVNFKDVKEGFSRIEIGPAWEH